VILTVTHIPPAHWWQRAQWCLRHDLPVVGITVPAGFVTDAISTPWFMFWLVSPTGRGFPAAVLHDYMLSLLPDGESRLDADELFQDALVACAVSPWRAKGMFYAVRAYAFFKGAF